jgi:hypothetical protein
MGMEQPIKPNPLKALKIKMCRTINLPVVLYGFETLFLTLEEKHGQNVM